jgi:hypothetical protein
MEEFIRNNWLTILFGLISVGEFIYAVITGVRKRQIEEANKKMMKYIQLRDLERCQRIFSHVEQLTITVDKACEIVKDECSKKGEPCNRVYAAVEKARTTNENLADYCITLNRSHFDEYGQLIDRDLARKLKREPCT